MKPRLNRTLLSIIFLLFAIAFNTNAQTTLDFGFTKSFSVQVYDADNTVLKNAWAGGLNACQFNAMDLNQDGTNDLVLFDRHGNRLLTFENAGISNQISYLYKPEYESSFPRFNDWLIIADYNGDGLDDLFTYSLGYAGIKVYKNTSSKKISFDLVVPKYLKSKQGSIYTNILVTYADCPAIVDLDRDGDLDILTFYGLGLFVELHKNMSIEKYGNADSLIYEKVDFCWGKFAESPESNIIKLDTCLNSSYLAKEPKHTGSTFLVQDLNGDGLDDLLLGDVDYPNVILLTNGGTSDEALMISQTNEFPEQSPLNLVSFPVLKTLDVNNDQKKDLLASSFDPSLLKSEVTESAWLYLNNGSNNTPDFQLQSRNFLQDQMIDAGAASLPVLHDFDNDGLTDLFIGNYGNLDTSYYDEFQILQCRYRSKLAYYKNTGTLTQPVFKVIDTDFANISSIFPDDDPVTGLFPTFGDVDADGDEDLITGNGTGTLFYFENQSISYNDPVFVLISDNYQQIDVGAFSTPQLIDLTGDNLLDLAIGNQNGTLTFYRNTGTSTQAEFTFTTDSLGKVNVRDPNLSYSGYSVPCFFKSFDNKLGLIVGSESGKISYYKDIENNLLGQFTKTDDAYTWVSEGIRTAPALGELNGDEFPDLIVGNYAGGLGFYQGKTPSPFNIDESNNIKSYQYEIYPNPADDRVHIRFSEMVDLTDAEMISIYGNTTKILTRSKQNYQDEFSFELPENLISGIYVLKLIFIKDHKLCTITHKLLIE